MLECDSRVGDWYDGHDGVGMGWEAELRDDSRRRTIVDERTSPSSQHHTALSPQSTMPAVCLVSFTIASSSLQPRLRSFHSQELFPQIHPTDPVPLTLVSLSTSSVTHPDRRIRTCRGGEYNSISDSSLWITSIDRRQAIIPHQRGGCTDAQYAIRGGN